MLVPVTQRIGIRISSSTFSTPMCAMPRAPPPDSARPILGAAADAAGGAVSAARRRLASVSAATAVAVVNARRAIVDGEFIVEAP
jgi:hypothetical protein